MFKNLKNKLKTVLQNFDEESQNTGIAVDDSQIKYDSLEIGQAVEIADSEGNFVVAPDGNYNLSDGTVISVKDGVISDIQPSTQNNQDNQNQDLAEDNTKDVDAKDTPSKANSQTKVIEDLTNQINDLETRVKKLEDSLAQKSEDKDKENAEMSKFSKQINDLENVLKEIAKMPIEDSKVSNNFFNKEANTANKNTYKNFLNGLK